MTDRELLELAAKAFWADELDDVCSIRWSDSDASVLYTHADNQDHNGLDREYLWNPLADDGDALRLAVKLDTSLEISEYEASTYAYVGPTNPDSVRPHAMELWGIDKADATRRAIVRAAAKIGRAMP